MPSCKETVAVARRLTDNAPVLTGCSAWRSARAGGQRGRKTACALRSGSHSRSPACSPFPQRCSPRPRLPASSRTRRARSCRASRSKRRALSSSRRSARAVTDGTGQYRIVDLQSRRLQRVLRADRLRHRQARGHRADRIVHRHGQRGSQGRQPRGNHHGVRRNADRRRAERAAAGDGQRRRDRVDSRRRGPTAPSSASTPPCRWAPARRSTSR